MRILVWQRAALALSLCGLAGCSTGFFHSTGEVASEGDWLHTWRSRPQGCTRDPADGAPIGQSTSVITLLWEDPGQRDPKVANRTTAPDAPMRLEFSYLGQGSTKPFAMLRTLRISGVPLDDQACKTLRITTQEHPARRKGGLPTLSGSLALDCQQMDGHITANVTFENCSY